jgi:dipeptidase E
MKLLLLSNSTNAGEDYLAYSKRVIQEFLNGHTENIIFIPYAGVTITWDEYTGRVNQALNVEGIHVNAIHHFEDPSKAIQEASSIMIGGGNSFQLLNLLYENNLLDTIRERVTRGIPFVGWSAGANMACPTLKTTNDMPIIEPPSFKSLGLVKFQLNPHYTEETLPSHGGESRQMRIEEFIRINPESRVLGLPEGMIIKFSNGCFRLIGDKGCKLFQHGKNSRWINTDEELNEFLDIKFFQ